MKTAVKLGLIVIAVLVPVYTQSSKHALVLLDDMAIKDTHSKFFKSLTDSGYKLTFKMSDEAALSLKKYGVWQYQHLIIFAPGTDEFGGDLSPEAIAEFVDNQGNVLVAGSPAAGDAVRDLAAEFGIELDDPAAYVIDHINYNPTTDSGKHISIVADPKHLIDAKPIVGSKAPAPLLYEGSSLLLDPSNPLVLPILRAPSSAYSYDPSKTVADLPHTVGRNTVLIAGLQARNNARVVFTGSLDYFSDKFFASQVQFKGKKIERSGNEDLSKAITQWVFKEQGVLRLSNVTHQKVGEKNPPAAYTITEDVVYSVVIEELDNGVWKGYSGKDVQLEFVRIDPFVRTYLTKVDGKGKYEAKFKIPDVYGVYQFKVDYSRKGYTFLSSATQVSVRPLQHTQYERFIESAYPYYASAFSMMVGLLIFSCVFLHFKDDGKTKSE